MNKYVLKCLCLVFVITLFSCQKDLKDTKKVPGALEGLQLLTKQRAYPANDIPSSGYYEAYEYQQKFVNSFDSQSRNADSWEPMGPWNTAGRVLALAINPQDDNTIYLGSASGGLWRSRSLGQGQSWEYVPLGEPVLGVSSIAFAKGDSSLMYIGTGEVYNYQNTGTDGAYRSTRGSYGMGILKSEDGGQTWIKSLDWTYQQERGIQSIKVHPTDPNIVYAATTEGILKTVNGGVSWFNVHPVLMATDIEIMEGSPDNLVSSHGNFGTDGAGIYRSTDAGNTWFKALTPDIEGFQGKIELTSNANKVMASVGNGFTVQGPDNATWLLSSNNMGVTWQVESTFDYSRWQGWFAHDVAIDPNNENNIITVGINVAKSQTGGQDLVQISDGGVALGTPPIVGPDSSNPFFVHSDAHVVMYHPNVPDMVLIGTDGGLYVSMDNGGSFESRNGGLQTTQFYNGFSVSRQDPNFAMGGLQDNSTSIFRGSETWQKAVGGDGSWTGINQIDDDIAYASAQHLYLVKSTNNGLGFNWANVLEDDALFIAPYVISPSNPNKVYAGSRRIALTANNASSWDFPGPTMNGDPAYSMAISESNEDVVYVGTAPDNLQRGVFLTTNGAQSFTDISEGLPDRFPNDLAVDPTNDAIAYVTFSGFGTGHIFKTEDYGNTWVDISYNLPDVPGNAIEVDPFNPGNLYYGNDLGVYFLEEDAQEWVSFDDGFYGASIVLDLKVSYSDSSIWAATHGLGAFRRDLVRSSDPVFVDDERISTLKVYPNPVLDICNIEFELNGNASKINLRLTRIDGTLMKDFSFNGTYKLFTEQIEISDIPKGTYFLQITENEKLLSSQTLIKI